MSNDVTIGRAERVERAIREARARAENNYVDAESQLLDLTRMVVNRVSRGEEAMTEITAYVASNLDNKEMSPERVLALTEAYKTFGDSNFRMLTAIKRGRDSAESELRSAVDKEVIEDGEHRQD